MFGFCVFVMMRLYATFMSPRTWQLYVYWLFKYAELILKRHTKINAHEAAF